MIQHTFVVNETRTTPHNGILRFNNLPIYEGSLVTAKYTVDNKLRKEISSTDNRADTTTLKVSVQTLSIRYNHKNIYSCN